MTFLSGTSTGEGTECWQTKCQIAREDKMLAILWDREDKMLIVTKHLIYHTDGQVN